MAGYEASGRVRRERPRFLPATRDVSDDVGPGTVQSAEIAVVDLTGERMGGRLGAVVARIESIVDDVREVWTQARRVMSDPQGWG